MLTEEQMNILRWLAREPKQWQNGYWLMTGCFNQKWTNYMKEHPEMHATGKAKFEAIRKIYPELIEKKGDSFRLNRPFFVEYFLQMSKPEQPKQYDYIELLEAAGMI